MEPVSFNMWVSIIASIAGIVLSIVAIGFAILVDQRSRRISDQNIKSLQKIESVVEHLSDNTRELIKAAWDKLLGSVERFPKEIGDPDAKQLASGLAAELKSELGLDKDDHMTSEESPNVEHLTRVVDNLQSSFEALLRDRQTSPSPSKALDRIFYEVSNLSPQSQALIRLIIARHLTRSQYHKALNSEPLSAPIRELRSAGFLIPVVHKLPDGAEEPCYYFPASFAKALSTGWSFLPEVSPEILAKMKDALEAIGYPVEAHKP
jgi:hypothetical protein